jgi:uncharacterized protein (DUF302 family)
MKKLLLISLALAIFMSLNAQTLKPYIKGIESNQSVEELSSAMATHLNTAGLNVLGTYNPMGSKDRSVIIVGAPELNKAVQSIKGLTGFAAALRVAITREDNKTVVSYTNPVYWGNAYFRDDYSKVSAQYKSVDNKLITAMKTTGAFIGMPFGSEDGISSDELHSYRYMFGMPRFDDTETIASFSSHQDAVNAIDNAFGKGVPNVKKVYSIAVPGTDLKLYGVALSGEDGENKFMPKIDISSPKHTAFLPYEFLVMGKEVHMLHGRYRIALSFPDLTMGTFTKIMSTPGDIEDMVRSIVK